MSDAQNSPYRKFIKSGNEERLQDGSRPGALGCKKILYNTGTEILTFACSFNPGIFYKLEFYDF